MGSIIHPISQRKKLRNSQMKFAQGHSSSNWWSWVWTWGFYLHSLHVYPVCCVSEVVKVYRALGSWEPLTPNGQISDCLSGSPSPSCWTSWKTENSIPCNSVSECVWLSRDEFEFNLACLTNSQRYLRNSPASISEIVCGAYFHWQAVLSLFLKQGHVSNSSGSVKSRDNKPPRIKCQCRKGAKNQLVQPIQYWERARTVLLAHSIVSLATCWQVAFGLPGEQRSMREEEGAWVWVGGPNWNSGYLKVLFLCDLEQALGWWGHPEQKLPIRGILQQERMAHSWPLPTPCCAQSWARGHPGKQGLEGRPQELKRCYG